MLHTSRRAVSAAALGGASAVLGFGYASEMPSREEDLPRRWDGAAIEAYWDARPFATLGRACAIARTVAPVLGGLAADYATAPRDEAKAARDARLRARAIQGRDALVALGPAFIKLGQALSIRPDVVPAAALDELRSLCDAVPAVPTTTALATIEAEVGAMAFGGLDASTPPVAAASLGQVYKVELEGRTVALKVQRPNVIAAVSLDLALLRKWARFVERAKVFLVPKQRPYDEALVEAFSRGAWSELDYEAEAANQEDMAAKLALATSRTLRRNLCRASKAEIARLVPLGVELFMWQMLDVGTYHCDPHPGNLLVDAQGRLALIDFGLCTEIDVGEREALTKAVVHLIQGAVPALIDDAVALDFLPADVDKEALYPVLSRVFEDARLAARASPDVAAVKKRRKEFGIAISGDPDFDIFKAAYPHGLRRAEQIFGRQGLAEISAAAAAAYLAPRRRATVAVDVGEDVVVAASS
ncbi:ABC1 family-like protein [Aureococcus anophagefferens]|nr:ABC1 family-like protein [Aureococcus anophagefferens]